MLTNLYILILYNLYGTICNESLRKNEIMWKNIFLFKSCLKAGTREKACENILPIKTFPFFIQLAKNCKEKLP